MTSSSIEELGNKGCYSRTIDCSFKGIISPEQFKYLRTSDLFWNASSKLQDRLTSLHTCVEKSMGNYSEHEASTEPIFGEAIKASLQNNLALNQVEYTALHNRYHWILENHDRKKSFMVINFDLHIIRFRRIAFVGNDPVYAFAVEDPSHFPFIIFPCSNLHHQGAIKNIRKYMKPSSTSTSNPLLGRSIKISVISDMDAHMNWVFEVIPPKSKGYG